MKSKSVLTVPRVLAALCVALALMCLYMAVAWKREHRRVECYRDQAEEGLIPDRKCEL